MFIKGNKILFSEITAVKGKTKCLWPVISTHAIKLYHSLKGTEVHIPIIGIHYDEEYYPNPNKFDPERFRPEAVAARHPMSFTPYGHGPRMCLGVTFAGMLFSDIMSLTPTFYVTRAYFFEARFA